MDTKATRWRALRRQYTLLPAALALIVALLPMTGLALMVLSNKRADIWVALIGSFWGFLLAQTGVIAYERAKQKEELLSMFIGAKNEL